MPTSRTHSNIDFAEIAKIPDRFGKLWDAADSVSDRATVIQGLAAEMKRVHESCENYAAQLREAALRWLEK